MKFIRFGLVAALLGISTMATAENPDTGRKIGKSKVPIPARSSAVWKSATNTWVYPMEGV